jgi:hypothetical protein
VENLLYVWATLLSTNIVTLLGISWTHPYMNAITKMPSFSIFMTVTKYLSSINSPVTVPLKNASVLQYCFFHYTLLCS